MSLNILCNKYQILANSNQQTQSYKFTSHIAAFLSVVLVTEMLQICIQTSYEQNVQLILKSYLPVVYGTPLNLQIRAVMGVHFNTLRPLFNMGLVILPTVNKIKNKQYHTVETTPIFNRNIVERDKVQTLNHKLEHRRKRQSPNPKS